MKRALQFIYQDDQRTKTMKKETTFLFLLMCMVTVVPSFAQSYATALGLRFGNDNQKRTLGITMQQRVLKHTTLEGILQTDFNHNTTAHALIKKHHGFMTKRFNTYVGTGIAFGIEESEFKKTDPKEIITTYGNTTLGVDLILGVEFTLFRYNFSLDYKPNFNLTGRNPWYRGQIGFSARSVLVKGATQNKKKRQKAKRKRKKQREKAKLQRQKSKEDKGK